MLHLLEKRYQNVTLLQVKVYNRRKKSMWKSRTMWFSFLLVVFGALYDNFSYLQNIIDPKYYGIMLVIIGIVVAILRFLTSQPMQD
jgi:hypothetical protein